jgi:CHAT domain-containing protein
VLNTLAQVQWADGRAREALETSLRAEVMAREQFERTVRNLSEREALQYEQGRVSGFDVALSSLAAPGSGRPPAGAVARVWEEVIRSRALVLDEMAARHQPRAERQDAEEKALSAELEAVSGRLARLAVRRPAGEDQARRESSLAAARSEKERAERALAEKRAARRAAREPAEAGLAWVSRALPEGAALVAYLKYSLRSGLSAPTPAGSAAPGKLAADAAPSYAAFVLPAGGGEPVMVSLGPAAEIEARIRDWMSGVSGAPRGLALRDAGADAPYRRAGERLRRGVWDPLAHHLRGARQVFVVPDGALHLVSLATLPDGEDRYLVESGPLLHYLSAERDLARAETALGRGLLVLGDPDFDAAPEGRPEPGGLRPSGPVAVPAAAGAPAAITAAAPASPALPPAASVSRAVFRGGQATCSDLRSLRFEPLAGSRAEAEEIAALWMQKVPGADVVKLTDARAGEAEFKREAAGRRIIHVATHGFFADDRCLLAREEARGGALAAARREREPAAGAAENPLVLSGLALAGANRREFETDGGEDGILTAEEVASLDLSGVEWAVLSACETGIGQVQAGEGVLGLRRAFEVAGARTLILSLWPVEDAAAREWMRGLYEGRLEGLTTVEAVRQASLKVIQRRRQAGRSAHPAFWGAFVATGDWR